MPLPFVVLLTAPEVYDDGSLATLDQGVAGEIAVLVLLSTFLGLPAVGVLPRWRWIFWLILIAFLLGLARVPVAVLELIGRLAPAGPAWYVVLQGGLRPDPVRHHTADAGRLSPLPDLGSSLRVAIETRPLPRAATTSEREGDATSLT